MPKTNFANITIDHLKLIHAVEDSFRHLKQSGYYEEFVDVLKLTGKSNLNTKDGILYFQYDSENESLRVFKNDGLCLLISGMPL